MTILLEGAAWAGSAILLYLALKPEVAKSRSGMSYIKGPHAQEFMLLVNTDIDRLLEWLRSHPELLADRRWQRLVKRYKTKMRPIAEGEGGAAYTRNKSDVRLCVPESLEERDVQTALFVALHELAHIANVSWGHDQSFWDTFRDLLRLAVRAKIYKRRNYRNDPARLVFG
ncbi:hypothetical protein KFL_007080110 [Klebsormidium nitens]|uniref:WLM domain-containing protein n=1 Tax=Klebsormidium nitens TaxID=105231 RepID=A0A1Y1IJS5_KLENI|nr:hypothetical protein KFL_007080110 [Klebsormidium nitens]|eukprot:GAQ90973.1 hypothetical protein KFL_007080110 [Klebsormidium nitens]